MDGFALTSTSADAQITPTLLQSYAAALQTQQQQLAAWWQRTPLAVSFGSPPSGVDAVTCIVQDALDDPNALAYHTVDANGRPLILVGWGVIKANGGSLNGPGDSLLSAISHELCECAVDPYCSWWWDLSPGIDIPLEVCDPTQGDTYEAAPGLFVSNFVGPRYFSSSAGPYDFMGLVTKPGELRPGGYQSQRTEAGAVNNVFGDKMAPWMRAAKLASKGRMARRSGT